MILNKLGAMERKKNIVKKKMMTNKYLVINNKKIYF